jgi:predicted glycogen debranching enzyme
VLTLLRNGRLSIASLDTAAGSIEEKLNKEWLLTNSRGSFAAGTIAGCNTRRYHGMLIGSTTPPANRMLTLSNCIETLIIDGEEFSLSTFEFNDRFAPEGFWNLTGFRRDIGVHFDFEIGPVHVTRSLYLAPDSDTIAIEYRFDSVGDGLTFKLSPMVGMRNFHYLQKSSALISTGPAKDGVIIRSGDAANSELLLQCRRMNWENNPEWWYNFHYRVERERGQDFVEDLFKPGTFKTHIEEPCRIVVWGHYGQPGFEFGPECTIDSLKAQLKSHQDEIIAVPHGRDKTFQKLCIAADQFVIKRKVRDKDTTSIIAGYPWFMDWGRDTFISMPGLLLATERFEEAAQVLTLFASAAEDGIIPNRFDDFTDQPHYNSIDASLWFIRAAFEYVRASCDDNLFESKLLPAIRWIIDCYYYGTKFGIHADSDGLITGGNAATQLTWMDAKFGDTAFTPRYGKAVEINALWHDALCSLRDYYKLRDKTLSEHYGTMADETARSFRIVFWNAADRCLFDCILPDGTIDSSIRPNQVFAVSLEHSPLTHEQQKGVVEMLQKYLLTPCGLRTLNVQSSRYHGRITGPQHDRDEAYHQGTVWPWLIGPFIEAYLRVNKFSRRSRRQAIDYIRPLLEHLTTDGCIGSISEVFDGDEPHRPAGAFAQAWSVAEVMRAYLLIID